jgi:hypothetical protein
LKGKDNKTKEKGYEKRNTSKEWKREGKRVKRIPRSVVTYFTLFSFKMCFFSRILIAYCVPVSLSTASTT